MTTVPNPPPGRVPPSGPLNGTGATPGALLRTAFVSGVTGAETAERQFSTTFEEIKPDMSDLLAPFFRPALANAVQGRNYIARGSAVFQASSAIDVGIQVSVDNFATVIGDKFTRLPIQALQAAEPVPFTLAYNFAAADLSIPIPVGATLEARMVVRSIGADTVGLVLSNADDGSVSLELTEVGA